MREPRQGCVYTLVRSVYILQTQTHSQTHTPTQVYVRYSSTQTDPNKTARGRRHSRFLLNRRTVVVARPTTHRAPSAHRSQSPLCANVRTIFMHICVPAANRCADSASPRWHGQCCQQPQPQLERCCCCCWFFCPLADRCRVARMA